MLKKIIKDSLYKNSLYLIINSILISLFGFIFWNITTKLFTMEQVGIATTLISAQSIIGLLASLGFSTSIIRFYSKIEKKDELINNSIILNTIFSLIVGTIFILGISIFSPKLSITPSQKIIFILSSSIWTLFSTTNSIFIAQKKSKLVLVKNLIFSITKLILPFTFVTLGAYGIFNSLNIATLLSLTFTLLIIKYKPKFKLNKEIIKNTLKFSLSNHLSSVFNTSFGYVTPLIITNLINPETTALFYIPWMIGNILFFIPIAVSQSFLAENSHNDKSNIKKSLKFTYLLTIPSVVFTIIISKYLLIFFKPEYAKATLFLQLISISTLFYSYNTIKNASLSIKHKNKQLIISNLIIAITSITLTILLINKGLIGIAIAWITSQIICCFYLILQKQ
ncbi:MAG TPA: oligosaccharide flippase family protein [Candidatus Nanoarchaeia archaeon]|nr:oligosaccharide flippase family protein [Candidatus Nanoarchaeia archaeon]